MNMPIVMKRRWTRWVCCLVSVMLLLLARAEAQEGFGTNLPHPSSVIELLANDKGLLIPRVSLQAANLPNPITSPSNSLVVYNMATAGTSPNNVIPGYYYWNEASTRWIRVLDANTVDNGLAFNATANRVQLGGPLVLPTTITATSANTLALAGLVLAGTPTVTAGPPAVYSQRILAVNSDNVIRALKAALPKFFYMPSVFIPTHNSSGVLLAGAQTLNLYSIYAEQFGFTIPVASTTQGQARSNASSNLPLLPELELDYFVTYFDKTVFDAVSISDVGVLTYTVRPGAVVTQRTFMNVVFKVKD